MKNRFNGRLGKLMLVVFCFSFFEQTQLSAQKAAAASRTPPAAGGQNPTAGQLPASPPSQRPPAGPTQPPGSPVASAPAVEPAPPLSESAKRSQADLEKLAAPIALYPDQLIATILPASAYPLEVVQAARFIKDTNNLAKLDEQPWDDNVKAAARIPEVIKQMDDNLTWTSDLGDAFITQPKELMDAIQTMRGKAKDSGALKTTEQQVVTVTNTVVTNIVESQTVYVTNQVVQIQPAQPEVIYVPQYNPTVVYAGYPVTYPGYYYPPYYPGTVAAASIVSFGAGMAMGAWMANGCNWGGGHVDVDVNHNYNRNVNSDRNVNRDSNVNRDRSSNRSGNSNRQWQPDQNRLKNSGASLSSAQNREARGYGNGQGANRAGTTQSGGQAANRAANGTAGNRAGTANTANRTSGANAANRASTANSGTRPSAGAGTRTPGTAGASASTANRGGNLSSTGNRSGSPSSAQTRTAPSRSSSSGSAFSGGNASSARSSSARGSSSRSFSGGGGGGASRGGGGRGGGGRR